MKKKYSFLIFILLLFVQTSLVESANNQTGIEIGEYAPNFQLKNLEGKIVNLTDYKGKNIMLNFWTTWCPPCKKEMLDIQQISKEKENSWVVLAVNIDGGNEAGVREFVQSRKLTFPILLDERDTVSNQYHILSIPTTFFIDKNGKIINKAYTMLTLEEMREIVKD
ncbi:redoxin domain-containing protein [Bacillus sp. B1-b2]|uniref:redoxin domain-containing protein n=1 Tax=Bacillus sp. B1-b2 TaxID=2653201 RepID=UPI00126172CC|nr:redoxin domain-containing protein [Bacillus sp. B1-b2]KAB7671112.1 redoxin domain-containing protein [Bacillus sp. B1-b2]